MVARTSGRKPPFRRGLRLDRVRDHGAASRDEATNFGHERLERRQEGERLHSVDVSSTDPLARDEISLDERSKVARNDGAVLRDAFGDPFDVEGAIQDQDAQNLEP